MFKEGCARVLLTGLGKSLIFGTSYFSRVTDCPIRSAFIVLTENQSEPDPSQGFPELFSPSVMRKREELWD